MAVDHNNSEDGKGNLSPLFTSKHNESIVGTALNLGAGGGEWHSSDTLNGFLLWLLDKGKHCLQLI